MRLPFFILYRAIVRFAGCLAHPYQTMQDVVREQTPVFFIFFPLILCIIGWLLARYAAGIFLFILPYLGLWWFLEVWWILFWALWQVTLLYLYWRFRSVRGE